MSLSLKIDPQKGFVALPAQLLDLKISPGAYKVLSILCNYADKEGWCWPSLEQIGKKAQRSKAAISGYLKELREQGLVETVEQKMASGYNYRLKFLVTFWKEWVEIRQQKQIKLVSKTERSVQHVDRPSTKKNNTNETHHSPSDEAEVSRAKKISEGWKSLTKGVPFGTYREAPSPALLSATEEILDDFNADESRRVTTVTGDHIQDFWKSLGVSILGETLTEQISLCKDLAINEEVFQTFCAATREMWKPFWMKPPAPLQLEEMLRKAKSKHPLSTLLRLISLDYELWKRRSAKTNSIFTKAA